MAWCDKCSGNKKCHHKQREVRSFLWQPPIWPGKAMEMLKLQFTHRNPTLIKPVPNVDGTRVECPWQ